MQFTQICDWVEIDAASAGASDRAGLIGAWVNSNPDTKGVARLLVAESNGDLSVRAYAIGPDGLIDWGTADVTVFGSSPVSRVAAGFTCRYDFGFAETLLQGMILKGLIVLAQFHSFKDDSNRVAFFVREYFALDHGRF
ncbi:hypothetical protein BH18ACI4_BH18ACI4_03980 [soil metagenome]